MCQTVHAPNIYIRCLKEALAISRICVRYCTVVSLKRIRKVRIFFSPSNHSSNNVNHTQMSSKFVRSNYSHFDDINEGRSQPFRLHPLKSRPPRWKARTFTFPAYCRTHKCYHSFLLLYFQILLTISMQNCKPNTEYYLHDILTRPLENEIFLLLKVKS